MCGIIGISSKECIKNDLYIGLKMLQHRGQDAFGLVTNKYSIKQSGFVEAPPLSSSSVAETIGIGHVRYPTHGSKNDANLIQPFHNQDKTLIFAFNGHISNVPSGFKSDTSWLYYLLTRTENTIYNIECVYKLCQGSFSCLFIKDKTLYAFRDTRGIRPLCFGQYKNNYAFSSESMVMNIIGYTFIRDVKPGECISVSGRFLQTMQYRKPDYTPCLFEYIYLARPDSVMDGILVYKARQIMGQLLAEKIKYNKKDIDMIIPVPETARISAIEMASILGIPYVEALVKNRYVPRTFIQSNQLDRINSVNMKFNIIESLVREKNVLIVDDSIVRGNTMKRIVQLVKRCGVKNVYIASCAPPVVNTNQYGIDIPSKDELIMNNTRNIEMELGVQHVYWQDLNTLVKALSTSTVTKFESECFTES